MEEHNRLRRQNEAPMHPSAGQRYMQDTLQGRRSVPAGTSERYNRPAPLNTSPSQGRGGMGGASSYSTYNYPDQVAGSFATPMAAPSTMHYQSGYGQDGRQQQQSFGGYNAMPMGYDNMAGAANPVYDAQQHFQRQPAAAPIMPADVSASYFASDPNNAPGAPNLPPHAQASSTSAAGYQAPSQMASYSSSNMSGVGSISQPAQADVSMEETDYPAPGGLEEKWIEYQTALRGVFQNIRGGALETASQSLLDLSNWLLTQVTDLGLNLDDQKLHGDRIKLWEDFNHAWLGLLQAQKDMSLSGRALQRGQSLMPHDVLDKMGKELSRLCDGIERHGLVDYQYGVWEQFIFDILIECLDIAQGSEGGGSGNGGTQANTSASSAR